jgi:hypothetical protein
MEKIYSLLPWLTGVANPALKNRCHFDENIQSFFVTFAGHPATPLCAWLFPLIFRNSLYLSAECMRLPTQRLPTTKTSTLGKSLRSPRPSTATSKKP